MVIYEIKMVKAPAKPGWLLLHDGEHVYLIPEQEFVDLIMEAGRRFRTFVPLAPYPAPIGLVWKTNKQIYSWVVKRLRKIQEKYDHILGLDEKNEVSTE